MIIYLLRNKITNKEYIGQTIRSIDSRLYQHVSRSKINKTHIANSINKYGIKNFDCFILDVCQTQEELDKKEIELIQYYSTLSPNGYNLDLGGKGGKKSPEACKRMSDGQKGKLSGRKGKKYGPVSDTSRMNKAKIGIKQSQETINKRIAKCIGKKRTEETKQKMSLARTGKPNYSKKRIIAINKHTNVSIGFYSVKDASEFLNIGRKSITNNLIQRCKSSGGYIFKYALDNEGAN